MRRLLPLLLLSLFAGHASAQITVNRSVIEFTDDARVQDVEVYNGGKHRIFLDLKAAEVLDPATETPTRVEFDDPRTAPVLVSPRQLLVPPGTRKRLRVILREGPAESDRIFRLSVKPYTGQARIAAPTNGGTRPAVQVLVGYDLLMIARPEGSSPALKVTRDESSIEFRNDGDTNVLLRRIVQCEAGVDPNSAAAETACDEIPANRLYAGETYRVKLPRAGSAERFPVKVWQSVGLDSTSDVF